MMNFFDKLAIAASIACIVISAIDKDYTEMMAWVIVTLWNIKDHINTK